MTTSTPTEAPASPAARRRKRRALGRVFLWIARAGVVAWAAFWIWFCLSVGLSEGGRGALIASGMSLGFLTFATLVWTRPTLGGIMMVGLGIFAWRYFATEGAQLLLALPAFILGVMSTLAGTLSRAARAKSRQEPPLPPRA